MKAAPVIEGDDCTLRLARESDLPKLRAWRNANREWFFDSGEITEEKHLRWWRKYQANDTDLMFVIETPAGSEIGQISLYDIQGANAEIGRLIIDEQFRREGYGLAAVTLLRDWAHRTFAITRIVLKVKPENHAACALYAQAGFGTRQMEWLA